MPYYRCKVCGFITESENIPGKCPACGVEKPFVEYKLPIDEKRWKTLELHLHPIAVHFPASIALFVSIFLGLHIIFPMFFPDELLATSKVLIVLFPIFNLLAMVLGRNDAKVRFKRTDTPFLKQKIIVASILFLLSLGLMLIVLLGQLKELVVLSLILVILAFICTGILGFIGGQITNAHIPAQKI